VVLIRKVAQAKTLAPQIVERHDLRSDQRMRRQNPEGHTDALPTEFGKAAVKTTNVRWERRHLRQQRFPSP
jgi:hypothetical protein